MLFVVFFFSHLYSAIILLSILNTVNVQKKKLVVKSYYYSLLHDCLRSRPKANQSRAE